MQGSPTGPRSLTPWASPPLSVPRLRLTAPGDCFAYAVAKTHSCRLLYYVGEEFAKSDIPGVL